MALKNYISYFGLSLILLAAICFAIILIQANKSQKITQKSAYLMCDCLYVKYKDENECKITLSNSIGDAAKSLKIVYLPQKLIVSYWGQSSMASLDVGHGCIVHKFQGTMPNGLDINK